MGETWDLILRVVHIFCGVFWAGAAMLMAGFVSPAISSSGPEGGKFMQQLMGPRRLSTFMSLSGILTVVAGAIMLWRLSNGNLASWFAPGYSASIAIGSLAGIIALVSGHLVQAPTAKKLARIGKELQAAGGPPKPEQLAEVALLQKRLWRGVQAGAILLAIAVLTMAAARAL